MTLHDLTVIARAVTAGIVGAWTVPRMLRDITDGHTTSKED